MHARIARFEGGDPGAIDAQVAEMKRQIEGARSGALPADAPEEARTLTETVSRFLLLVDRESGASVGVTFCETEEDMRRANEALDRMSPDVGAGRRTGVEILEVALDESFR